MRPLVKICGITNFDDALLSLDLGATMLGLIFAKSPRQINMKVAEQITNRLSGRIILVGVFSHLHDPIIAEVCSRVKLDLLQIYFDCYTASSNSLLVPVMPAYFIKRADDLKIMDDRNKFIDFKYAPSLLQELDIKMDKAIIAGGLNSDNITGMIEKLSPFGVDTCSGVESSPGVKDRRKLEAFMKAVGV